MSGELINTLIHKEKFYALCDQYGIDHPDTFIYRPEMGHDFTLPFQPPYICKPANGVAYWEHPLPPATRRSSSAGTGGTWRPFWTRSTPPAIRTP